MGHIYGAKTLVKNQRKAALGNNPKVTTSRLSTVIIMSCYQNAGQNHTMTIGKKFFENAEKYKMRRKTKSLNKYSSPSHYLKWPPHT